MNAMNIDLSRGDCLVLKCGAEEIRVTLLDKSGQRARVEVKAPKTVSIHRPPKQK